MNYVNKKENILYPSHLKNHTGNPINSLRFIFPDIYRIPS